MSAWPLAVIILLILVNALYVAAEFAIVGVRTTRVELLAAQGHRAAAAVLPILRDTAKLDRYIAGCQVGITLSSLILGAFGQATIALGLGALLIAQAGMEPVGAYALAATLTLVVLTSIQVVLGELIPKTVALQYPVGTVLFTHLPMRWSLVLMAPFIDLLNGSGSLILRQLGITVEASHRHVHAPDELDLLIRESRAGGMLEDRESERLREALQLGQHRIRQVMVPRRQIAGLDLAAPLEQLIAESVTAPYTRLVAYRGGLEDVRGYLHIKDLTVELAAARDLVSLEPLVRPLLVLPSTLTIDRALGEMRDRQARIALLVDEYGDIEGLVSLEDILRELLGELSDEFKSATEMAPTPLPDGRWRLPGRLPFDEVLAWSASLGTASWANSSEAETLAGWLLEQLDAIPAGACCVLADGLVFEVERMDGAAIESVLVSRHPATQGQPDA